MGLGSIGYPLLSKPSGIPRCLGFRGFLGCIGPMITLDTRELHVTCCALQMNPQAKTNEYACGDWPCMVLRVPRTQV